MSADKQHVITIRVTSSLAAELEAAAARELTSLSALSRRALLRELERVREAEHAPAA
jgi:hypothetical protein